MSDLKYADSFRLSWVAASIAAAKSCGDNHTVGSLTLLFIIYFVLQSASTLSKVVFEPDYLFHSEMSEFCHYVA